ncbi:hypothetical protein DTO217A2_2026 [Paecilomyces variotii]|nr:hypothetical protein DTO217A2_2026 [Paecilomyces variotii]
MESVESRMYRTNSESSPNNTDSMVTVPLSDIQSDIQSNPQTPNEWKTFDIPEVPVEESGEQEGPVGDNAEGQTTPTIDCSPTTVEGRERRVSDSSERSRNSRGSEADSPPDSEGVNWEGLEKTEELEPRNEGTDESTALLLARLEQENNALATNPKSGLSKARSRAKSRPPSVQQIKKLVNDPRSSVRFSQLPTPQMTELEFWAALVQDYPQTAQRLPTLTSNKIRSGVPPPLRGVVWPSIAGARDMQLQEEFQRLCGETSPYEGLIGKDIGRSFPNVDMFRDPDGEGQQMLARVLKCFSLYDTKIGYCQGLGFVVGPLLMHMTDAEAFCVLVRLMDHYGLRSCFLPDLSGLHLRIYQFQNLLCRHRPALFAHLESLHIEPVYVSQWFLSFFAVTCPLPMLLRIYDVLLLEGACETLMRVALSLMQRNEKKLMACTEFEDVMQILLSRSLWDTYACHADDLVNDFVSLTSLVSKESLQSLETSYNQSQGVQTGISFPQMQAAASRFLGRLWSGGSSTKSLALNPSTSSLSRPASSIRRSPSKQSVASTLNSFESTSDASTAPTEMSQDSHKSRTKSAISQNKDKDLHGQIEDLLMALSDLQREQAELAQELQREREEREEDQELAKSMLSYIKGLEGDSQPADIVAKAEERFLCTGARRMSIAQTKHELRDDANRWKEKYELEAARCSDLGRRMDEYEHENTKVKEELRETRARVQDGYREKQRLEKVILELRSRKSSDSPDRSSAAQSEPGDVAQSRGLRELKLVRSNSQKTTTTTSQKGTWSKRSSSLGLQSVLSTENNKPAGDETLLLELVNAKTAEAVAKQELEEVKAKLDSLRKMFSNPHNSVSRASTEDSIVPTIAVAAAKEPTKTTSSGGFFSGWGRRTPSTSNATYTESK